MNSGKKEIVTDLQRVKELAAKMDDENWKFRTFLKNVDREIEELDAIVHRHLKDVQSQIDCCACGNCCREQRPILSCCDIRRIASGLKISEAQMTERYLKQELF